MILTYHKVQPLKNNDALAISLFSFIKQMYSLRTKTIVYFDNYNLNDEEQVVITFDDGYKDVIQYALPVLDFFNYPFEVFLVSDFFEEAEQGNKNYLNRYDLSKIVKKGGRLQYHSKSHPRLELIKDTNALEEEIKPLEKMRILDPNGFKYFAYPFWTYNDDVIYIVKKYYHGARSGNGHANGTVYAMDSIRI